MPGAFPGRARSRVEVLYRDDDVVSAVASGGPLTLTRYDDLGTAGTYLLTTSDDTIAGAFDVERYDP